jgi:hypothetical protein
MKYVCTTDAPKFMVQNLGKIKISDSSIISTVVYFSHSLINGMHGAVAISDFNAYFNVNDTHTSIPHKAELVEYGSVSDTVSI